MYKYLINDYEKEVFDVPYLGKVYSIKNLYGNRRPIQFLGYSENTGRFYIFDLYENIKQYYTEYMVIDLDATDLLMLCNKEVDYNNLISSKLVDRKIYMLVFEAYSQAEIAIADESDLRYVNELIIDERPQYLDLDERMYYKLLSAFMSIEKEDGDNNENI